MREIKFRAWDKRFKQMYLDVHSAYNWATYLCSGGYELMQYTGLKDKNGKEIYGGDIIFIEEHQGTGLKYAVDYDKGIWMLKNRDSELDDFLTNFKEDEVEVIGNIYENPELLVK